MVNVTQHDGSVLALRKLNDDYDPNDRLGEAALCPGSAALDKINAGLR